MAYGTIRTNEQRNQHTPRANAGEQVGHVGIFALPAHVGRCNRQLVDGDKIELPDFFLSFNHTRPRTAGRAARKGAGPATTAGATPQGPTTMAQPGRTHDSPTGRA